MNINIDDDDDDGDDDDGDEDEDDDDDDDDDDDGVTREKILEPQARHRPTPCGVQLSNLSKAGDVYFGFIRLSLSLFHGFETSLKSILNQKGSKGM